jgi:hypothetical protein
MFYMKASKVEVVVVLLIIDLQVVYRGMIKTAFYVNIDLFQIG